MERFTEPYGSPTLATYPGDPGRSLCQQIADLAERVKILTDVIFQLTQKLGDQANQPHRT
jgi:hypothetical protein